MEYQHTPVMLKEVIWLLAPRPGENYLDCTLGGAGYTLEIAKRIMPGGKILAIDLDKAAINNAAEIIKKNKYQNIILANENFKNLSTIVKKYFAASEADKFSGIVFDLGLSSAQLQDGSRGFSFQLLQAPLNMSFAAPAEITAQAIINNYSRQELTKIFRDYGEEKFAYQIAGEIIKVRQKEVIKTVGQLVNIVKQVIPARWQSGKIHPATKIFQALRLAVNNELENLQLALTSAVALLAPCGKIAVVTFHSLEDRVVKKFFREESRDCLCPPTYPACRCQHQARLKIITPRVIRPSEEEVLNNPRARSAKLRVAERIIKNNNLL